MNAAASIILFASFPCSFFCVGGVTITPAARNLLSDEEIATALTRHTHQDFGEVSWEHCSGNLELIAESRGTITSIYTSLAGTQFYVMTRLDEFEPLTRILIP